LFFCGPLWASATTPASAWPRARAVLRSGRGGRLFRTACLIRPDRTGIDPVVLGVQLHGAQVEIEVQPLRFVVDPGVQQIVLRVEHSGQCLVDVASGGGAKDAHLARLRRLLQAELHHIDLIDGHVNGRPPQLEVEFVTIDGAEDFTQALADAVFIRISIDGGPVGS